ncbi:DUF819 family protein [Haliangium sp.]|uniref:DUF819 family protein n=1 Tax=Haliangium sp. TaxID=2663208 RepID=UPI003D0A507B
MTAAAIAFYLLVPVPMRWLVRRWRALDAVGPVVLCYAVGILLGNQPWLSVDADVAKAVAGGTVIAAISLLLLSLDLAALRTLARDTARALACAFAAVLAVSALAAWLYRDLVSEVWQISGMLVSIYTGGTPNMAAVATALDVAPERFLALNAAEIATGGTYLLFLLMLGARVFGRLLPAPAAAPAASSAPAATSAAAASSDERTPITADAPTAAAPDRVRPGPADFARAFGLAALVVGASAGAAQLAPADARDTVTILLVTTLAALLSTRARVRRMPGTYELGDYLLLVFCVAVGSLAKLELLAAADPILVAYTVTVLLGSIVVHAAACRVLGIDRDACLITQTAALYGPAFVLPVAQRLGNRAIVLAGISAGVVGLAAGNYLGLAMAWVVRALAG